MAHSQVTPTGAQRAVPAHDLFFSTTDSKGVITAANSVFVRMSHYDEDTLLGTSHNIVRHPDMPAGLFHIMWDRILTGRPFAGYVRNLAADGAEYWTFTTVTPLGEGFLSVRAAVSRRDQWEIIHGVYEAALGAERDARAQGASASEAARVGAAAIENALRETGYEGFEDAMRHLLPAEVVARMTAAPQTSGTLAGGVLGTVMTSTTLIEGDLEELLTTVDSSLALATHVRAARARIEPTIASLVAASQAATEAGLSVAQQAPTLSRAASAATHLAADAQTVLGDLAHDLVATRDAVLELRVVIALTSLHNSMALNHARSVAMRDEGKVAAEKVAVLCDALTVSLDDTHLMMQSVRDKLGRVATHIARVHETLHAYQRMLSQWRYLVARFGVGAPLRPYVAPIDAQLAAGLAQMQELRELGLRALEMSEPVDIDRIRDAVFAMNGAVRAGDRTRR